MLKAAVVPPTVAEWLARCIKERETRSRRSLKATTADNYRTLAPHHQWHSVRESAHTGSHSSVPLMAEPPRRCGLSRGAVEHLPDGQECGRGMPHQTQGVLVLRRGAVLEPGHVDGSSSSPSRAACWASCDGGRSGPDSLRAASNTAGTWRNSVQVSQSSSAGGGARLAGS